MIRKTVTPRRDWKEKVAEVGLTFHTIKGEVYWDESHYYEFDAKQIDIVEDATNALHAMAIETIKDVIARKDYADFRVDERFIPLIEDSFYRDAKKTIYGRFDLSYNGDTAPKMLEYNADTPTSLLEASIAQWFWLQDTHPNDDQFNSIDEKLLSVFGSFGLSSPLYFTCVDSEEDFMTVTYLRDVAERAGVSTNFIDIGDIGWHSDLKKFVDGDEAVISNLFKLYPWEWLVKDTFSQNILTAGINMFEPAWKMLLSNKALVVKMWRKFPFSPYLLKADFSAIGDNYVKKPIYSREGANISIVSSKGSFETSGNYDTSTCVYQEFCPLPNFEGNYPVIGSWIVGNTACGMGIREDATLITANTSRFVPHLFKE